MPGKPDLRRFNHITLPAPPHTHATVAAAEVKPSKQTVPSTPWCSTISRPDVCVPLASRSFSAARQVGQGGCIGCIGNWPDKI